MTNFRQTDARYLDLDQARTNQKGILLQHRVAARLPVSLTNM
jgi:hypothetical protein